MLGATIIFVLCCTLWSTVSRFERGTTSKSISNIGYGNIDSSLWTIDGNTIRWDDSNLMKPFNGTI